MCLMHEAVTVALAQQCQHEGQGNRAPSSAEKIKTNWRENHIYKQKTQTNRKNNNNRNDTKAEKIQICVLFN